MTTIENQEINEVQTCETKEGSENQVFEYISEYSKLLSKLLDDSKTNVIRINSCNKIDNLPVSVFMRRKYDSNRKKTIKYCIEINLNFETYGLYEFTHTINRVYYEQINCNKKSETKNIENAVKNLIELASTLKFDNYQCKFIKQSENRFYTLEREAFKNNLDDKECPVCFEHTTCTTLCDHPICVNCFYNIKKKK